MAWEWSKVDEKGLARFVTEDAVSLVTLPVNRHDLTHYHDGRLRTVEAIYKAWNAPERQERDLFEHELLTAPDQLCELIDIGAYLAIECTGFARSANLPGAIPEGVGRTADGLLPFDRAITAGREQFDRSDRPFRFALDIAVARYHWRIEAAMPRTTDVASRSSMETLDKRLDETLRLYLGKVFKDDQYARLAQAGEIDPDRSTLLHQVFVDLEVKPSGGKQPRRLRRRQAALFEESQHLIEDLSIPDESKALSAMACFLGEKWSKIVVIGGPGQGKSTLGQYVAQVHRKILLEGPEELKLLPLGNAEAKGPEFVPETPRVPFRIVLKYFAQWLADRPQNGSVEAYLAEQIKQGSARSVSSEGVQNILRARACLVIFDGLDEVTEPDLRDRLLSQVEAFLGRAEQLGTNLQVMATSRPTGYSEQFDPEQF